MTSPHKKRPRPRAAELAAQINPDDIRIAVNPELPQPVSMDKVVQDEIAKTETICEKARRLAWEERKQEREQAVEAKQTFLNQFELAAYWDDEHEYGLCGYRWKCQRQCSWDDESEYRLFLVDGQSERYSYSRVGDLLSLGRLVVALDEEKATASIDAYLSVSAPSVPWWKRAWRNFLS